MADFCTSCHKDHGFHGEPDIDVEKILSSLKNGYYEPVLCEGCALTAIGKKDDGTPAYSYMQKPLWTSEYPRKRS